MKKSSIALMGMALLVATACGEKKSAANDIITIDYQLPTPGEPIAMSSDVADVSVTWVNGASYDVTITRMPVDSLPMVMNDIGQKYIDNVVTVSVSRADGSTFFKQKFSKASFVRWLNSEYKESALLEGIDFYEAEAEALVFTAVLNVPDAADDEAVSLRLSVDTGGGISIEPYDDELRDDLIQGAPSVDGIE